MKVGTYLVACSILISCMEQVNSDLEFETKQNYELYQSSEDSFQKNFYLKIENERATIYGWEVANENDTIYYRSTCQLEQDLDDKIRISLTDYQLTTVKTTEFNLDEFKENKALSMPFLGAHSSFWGEKLSEDTFSLLAVKHNYMSRADEFRFEKIK